MFHVSSSRNRASIDERGLDSRRMGLARGIAGSHKPEADGIFVCDESLLDFFIDMNNTGGPVDVWAVDGVDDSELVASNSGFSYVPRAVPRPCLTLVRGDIAPEAPRLGP